ncbi:MAG TPA: hypothetical protein DCE41_05480 [Cytophagales bacterium]|nr:hypothetical protein [Cytophagales bacterium]HAP58689.1 hypothetical protein [Cytophagales bacterium]
MAVKLVRALIYTNLWIASGAASLFWAGYQVLGGGAPPLRTLVFLFCSTLITYNLHWLLAGRTYCANRPEEKYQWYARFYPWGLALFGLALVGELWGVLGLGWREWFFFAHLGAISLLYNLPEQRTLVWLVSIRRIPFLKIFLIAYVWATLGAGYPALLLDALSPQAIFWFAALLLYTFAITLPFDIRDLIQDRQVGLRTLPDRWGLRTTQVVAQLCLATALLCLVLAGVPFWVGALLVIPASAGVQGTRPHRPELYFTGFLDGLLVAFGPLVFWGI